MCPEKVSEASAVISVLPFFPLFLFCFVFPTMTSVNLTLVSFKEQGGVLLGSLSLCDGKGASARTMNFDMDKEMYPGFGAIFLMQEQSPLFVLSEKPICSFKTFLIPHWLPELNNVHRWYSFSSAQ